MKSDVAQGDLVVGGMAVSNANQRRLFTRRRGDAKEKRIIIKRANGDWS